MSVAARAPSATADDLRRSAMAVRDSASDRGFPLRDVLRLEVSC
jgi:hypothetical protein